MPITYRLAKDFNVAANIIRAQVAPNQMGKLVVELPHPSISDESRDFSPRFSAIALHCLRTVYSRLSCGGNLD